MTKDTLRNEIEKIQLDLVEKTANPTTKWEDVIPEATSQILSLLEGREREARIDELECLKIWHEDPNNDYGEQQVIDTSAYIDERIKELESNE